MKTVLFVEDDEDLRRASAQTLSLAGFEVAAAADGALWLFSSSEAITNLCQCLPGTDWSAARALVTHPRIGDAARAAGFGAVHDTRPTLEAVAASIESLNLGNSS